MVEDIHGVPENLKFSEVMWEHWKSWTELSASRLEPGRIHIHFWKYLSGISYLKSQRILLNYKSNKIKVMENAFCDKQLGTTESLKTFFIALSPVKLCFCPSCSLCNKTAKSKLDSIGQHLIWDQYLDARKWNEILKLIFLTLHHTVLGGMLEFFPRPW